MNPQKKSHKHTQLVTYWHLCNQLVWNFLVGDRLFWCTFPLSPSPCHRCPSRPQHGGLRVVGPRGHVGVPRKSIRGAPRIVMFSGRFCVLFFWKKCWKNYTPWNSNGNLLFQGSIFRGYVSFREGKMAGTQRKLRLEDECPFQTCDFQNRSGTDRWYLWGNPSYLATRCQKVQLLVISYRKYH